jgi:hypothetical protein
LEQAIMSVAIQTYEGPIELIIVDDGSKNASEIVPMATKYKLPNLTIKVRNMPHCGNLAVRRNDGLQLASGDYIFLLDDDNAMAPARISLCIDYLEKVPECDAVYHLSRFMGVDDSLGGLVNFYREGEVDRDSILNKRNHIDSGEVCLRSDTIRRFGIFDERCIILEDWDMWRRILTFGRMDMLPGSQDETMLSHYRSQHNDRRVAKMSSYDNQGMQHVLGKKLTESLKCDLMFPQNIRDLTFTQVDVGAHIFDAIQAGGMQHNGSSDVSFMYAPFRHHPQSKEIAIGSVKATIHVEDPFAHRMNVAFVKEGIDWVFTNDEGMLKNYEAFPVKRCVMPSISAFKFIPPDSVKKRYDVCFVGTPYPERVNFFNELAEVIDPKIKVYIAGLDIPGGISWNQVSNKFEREARQITPEEAMDTYAAGKVVLALNRMTGESPVTPIRGFMEASSGSCVLMDTRRSAIGRYFNSNEMAFFDDAKACANVIGDLLADNDRRNNIAQLGFDRSKDYSYEKRIRYALQCIQSSRECAI